MKKILIIDDDEHLREDLLDILSFEGYNAIGAENGHEGFLCAQAVLPDLILCDVMMPVMNGFEMLAMLRQHPQMTSIPVIFLSAQSEQSFVQNGMRLGATAYIPKPYTAQELLTAIQTHISD